MFGLHVQAGARHGLEKKGLPTTYHLTLAPEPVRVHAGTLEAEFVAVLDPHAFEQGDPLEGLNEGGTLYVEDSRSAVELWRDLPLMVRQVIARRRIQLCTLDAVGLAREIAGEHTDAIPRLRALAVLGAFLRLTRFRQLAGFGEVELFEAVNNLLEQKFAEHGNECIRCGLLMIGRAYRKVEVLETAPDADRSLAVEREAKLRAFAVQSVNGPLVPSGFNDWIVGAYLLGRQGDLPADLHAARSLVPPGNAGLRTFRNMTPALPVFAAERCTACMECVNHCPDAAIRVRVAEPSAVEEALTRVQGADYRGILKLQFATVPRFEGSLFGLFIDPDKCKGCGECVDACGTRAALAMQPKNTVDLAAYQAGVELFASLPATPAGNIDTKQSPADMFLSDCAGVFEGGAESCIGCGEAAAVRLLLSATAFWHGRDKLAVIAAPGCPSEFSSVYPFNPYQVSWTQRAMAKRRGRGHRRTSEMGPGRAQGTQTLGGRRLHDHVRERVCRRSPASSPRGSTSRCSFSTRRSIRAPEARPSPTR